ncbi:protein-disulfide reductase DsbD domain-containing protein [Sphingomonas sp. ASV193]|uniref:protein-disulfide reductase DsbD family protein n=1 Tax=Sphingomonas sp. ASV193 TaxID=3144405 RepID=UPI0032E85BED
MIRRLLFLLALLMPGAAMAQATHIVPEMVAEGPVAPGGTVDVAIVMHTGQGWHGYWKNPGAAGLPLTVEWTLPAGARLDPLRFPVPQKLLVAGLVNYVYEHDYALLTRLHVPAGASGTAALSGKASWLACTDKICVPERAEISLSVPVGPGAPTQQARFDQFRRALPRPLAAPARFALQGGALKLAIPLPASVSVAEPYFFPADQDVIDYAAPQPVAREGDLLVVTLTRADGAATPTALGGVLALGDGRGLEVAAVPGPVPDLAPTSTDARAILPALLGALAGGILLNLMPCVFPILALKGVHLARAGGDERAARREALAYAGGAIVGTGALGAALLAIRAGGSAAGWAFQLQDPRTTILLLLLASAITLNLLRAYELPVLGGSQAPAGSFGTGLLAAFVATPCAGPFLGAALGSALALPAVASVPVFAALGFGLALPFVALAFVPALRNRLPRPGPWMARLQRFLALPMAASAAACLWLLYRQGGTRALLVGLAATLLLALVLLLAGARQRSGKRSAPLALGGAVAAALAAALLVPPRAAPSSELDGAEPWSEARVASHLAKGEPVFAYFTADWCLTCKVNEAGAIDRQAVRDAFAAHGVKVVAGDWTNGDPAIGRFLEARGRAGVPLYLWYVPGRPPEELPQLLTPAMLTSRAQALPESR